MFASHVFKSFRNSFKDYTSIISILVCVKNGLIYAIFFDTLVEQPMKS